MNDGLYSHAYTRSLIDLTFVVIKVNVWYKKQYIQKAPLYINAKHSILYSNIHIIRTCIYNKEKDTIVKESTKRIRAVCVCAETKCGGGNASFIQTFWKDSRIANEKCFNFMRVFLHNENITIDFFFYEWYPTCIEKRSKSFKSKILSKILLFTFALYGKK